ncbi:hypothetical protein ES703_31383 [subsurface metagenome]
MSLAYERFSELINFSSVSLNRYGLLRLLNRHSSSLFGKWWGIHLPDKP